MKPHLPPIDHDPERFRHLPEPIRLEDTVETVDTNPVPDPDGGRDPQRDFTLRYAGPAL